jgi:hypothetical protein
MASISIPSRYQNKTGGETQIHGPSVDAIRSELVTYGIPYALTGSFSASPDGKYGTSFTQLRNKVDPKARKASEAQNRMFALGADNVVGAKDRSAMGFPEAMEQEMRSRAFSREQGIDSGGVDTGFGKMSIPTEEQVQAMRDSGIGGGSRVGLQGSQFLTPEQRIAMQPKGAKQWQSAPSQFSPNEMRDIYPQVEGGLEDTGAGLTDEQKYIFEQNAPPSGFSPSARGGATSFGESLGIDEIIGMFVEGGKFGGPTSGPPGEEILNPLLAELLTTADLQNNRVSLEQIADMEARSREKVAEFNKTAAIEIARQNGLSDVEVARLTSEADTAIAEARLTSDQYVASREGMAAEQVALTQGAAMKAAASSQAGGVKGAASEARLGQEAAAKAAAGAASPFGFMQQAADRENALGEVVTPEDQLASIYEQLNQVGLAQAGASNIGAQGNAFSFAAGQGINPVTGELNFNPNQIAQIAANTPAAFAARGQVDAAQAAAGGQLGAAQAAAGGQEAAARAGATGFGALLSGDTGVNQQANEILRAQAANNPYAMQQLGQGWANTDALNQNLRIDQILRGGLTPEQRIAEINASQAGQNFANQLNFMSNPSAVGFATEQGLFGGGNNQVLQDINNSPEGNVPGSLFGFNSPSAAGAGGGQTTNTGNFNANTLRNASDEQIGFLQGAASAGGQTSSEFEQEVQSFTPQGV